MSSQQNISGLQIGDGELFPEPEIIDGNNQIPLNGVDDTTIDVWYGSSQDFGQIGNPQKWVNILGNVSDPDGVTSLSYTLNGSPQKVLSIGPDDRRLALPGDFNIDIDRAELVDGANQVVITAVDGLSNPSSTTVTVNYTAGNTWPLPYSIDWSTTSDIQDVAQVVDGDWTISPNGLRVGTPGYDRLVAIGDVTWTDYEVLVPITIHNVDYAGAGGVSGEPALGVLMRWQGHTDNPVTCSQPKCGWVPNGNIGQWRFNSPIELQWYSPSISQTFIPALGTEYLFRIRVESTPGSGGLYSLKVWEADQIEPASWNLTIQESASDLASGSFLLLAHHVDATFGNVTVTPLPLPSYTLSVTSIGNGSVTRNPDKDSYAYNEMVALEAFPELGWSFSNWSGDINTSENPTTVIIIDDTSVTANFNQDEYLLTTYTAGNGTITKDPDQSTYNYNDVVTLTAVPDPGWIFARWSGDVTSTGNPLEVTIQNNTSVTATFTTDDEYSLTANTVGSGSVDVDPQQTTYHYGDVVTMTAVADTGWTFARWSGDVSGTNNPLEVTIQNNTSITATFTTDDEYSLTVNTVGGGSVDVEPEQTSYHYGDVVTMTAVADIGWSFAGWSGDASGSDNSIEYTIQGDTTITATFTQAAHTLTITPVGDGSVDLNPEKEIYLYGDVVTLTPTPAYNWYFMGWSGDQSGDENPLILLIEQDTNIIATFNQELYFFPFIFSIKDP